MLHIPRLRPGEGPYSATARKTFLCDARLGGGEPIATGQAAACPAPQASWRAEPAWRGGWVVATSPCPSQAAPDPPAQAQPSPWGCGAALAAAGAASEPPPAREGPRRAGTGAAPRAAGRQGHGSAPLAGGLAPLPLDYPSGGGPGWGPSPQEPETGSVPRERPKPGRMPVTRAFPERSRAPGRARTGPAQRPGERPSGRAEPAARWRAEGAARTTADPQGHPPEGAESRPEPPGPSHRPAGPSEG